MTDQEVKEVIGQLQKWHANIVRQLTAAATSKSNIQLLGPDGKEIKLNQEQSKGIKNGLLIALDVIGEFPVTITETSDEEE